MGDPFNPEDYIMKPDNPDQIAAFEQTFGRQQLSLGNIQPDEEMKPELNSKTDANNVLLDELE